MGDTRIYELDVATETPSNTNSAAVVTKDASTGAANIPSGTTAQRPVSAAAGMFRYNSDTGSFEGYTTDWGSIAGGGGGGSLQWRALAPTAPALVEENNEMVYEFSSSSERLYASIKVPQSYNGAQIKLFSSWYHDTGSVQVDLQATTTLVRSGTDLITSTTNQATGTAQIATTTANRLEAKTFNLTDASGEINAVPVSAGDLILVTLERTDSNAGIAKFIPNGTELKFN